MNLINSINLLENCVIEIESQLIQIDSHNNNANMATAGSAAAYFLTSDSKNKMVKTIGQVAAIGGVIYSANQRNKANSIESIATLNIGKAINIMERDCKPYIRNEKNIDTIRTFLEMSLRLGASIDVFLKKTINKLRWTGHLGKKNQAILMHIYQIEIINHKLKHNNTLNFIDKNIQINDPSVKFISLINKLDTEKIKKEGLWMRIIILSLITIGALLANNNNLGQYLIFSGLGLWVINHFYPIFSETKKLKNGVDTFCSEIKETIGIKKISLA